MSASVYAADPKPTIRDDAYSARYVSQSTPDPIVMQAGETKTVQIRFKNTGTTTWNSKGSRYISAYTMEPRDRVSVFLGKKQTNPIDASVAPGEIGTLTLTITAPTKPGKYTEAFYLAAENYSWMKGGYFYLDITVVAAKTSTVSPTTPKAESSNVGASLTKKVKVVGQSKKQVSVAGGEEISLKVLLQNIGTESWNGYRLAAKETGGASLVHDSWASANIITTSETVIAPGAVIKETIRFRAPAKVGTYSAQFSLVDVAGDHAVVTITVTEDANGDIETEYPNEEGVVGETPKLSEEPRIRVGLLGEGNTAQFVSYEDDYRILTDGQEVGVLPQKKVALIIFDNGTYRFRGAGLEINTKGVLRLEPATNPHAVIQVMNGLKDRSVSWVGSSAFTNYRGAVEYRRGEKDGELYVVNDLLLEDYVAGIAETGKEVHEEAVKANIVAARTYAYLSKGKYSFFDVLGSTYDQLYLGADVAQYLPKVPSAAQTTRGRMVTYNGEVVTTPYFGNSNGSTKSWSSVWGGANKPWLVPVVATYDKGKRQFGHGVGMSQRDAALRAQKDGWTYTEILGHYYTDTTLTLMYR